VRSIHISDLACDRVLNFVYMPKECTVHNTVSHLPSRVAVAHWSRGT